MNLPIEAAFRDALVDPAQPVPAGLVSPRGDVDPARFAVYRNNVHVSLVEALRARFPVCQHLVGEAFFTAMARLYVADHKPASPVMLAYGDDFADFIGGFAAARPVPYLAEIAALEIAWSQAYNAADAPALKASDLSGLTPDRLIGARLIPHPAMRILESRYPVGSIWSAHQSTPPAPLTHQGAEVVLITRPDASVAVTRINPGDGALVVSLAAGNKVSVAAHDATTADPAFELGGALVGLLGLGAFTSLMLDPEDSP